MSGEFSCLRMYVCVCVCVCVCARALSVGLKPVELNHVGTRDSKLICSRKVKQGKVPSHLVCAPLGFLVLLWWTPCLLFLALPSSSWWSFLVVPTSSSSEPLDELTCSPEIIKQIENGHGRFVVASHCKTDWCPSTWMSNWNCYFLHYIVDKWTTGFLRMARKNGELKESLICPNPGTKPDQQYKMHAAKCTLPNLMLVWLMQ